VNTPLQGTAADMIKVAMIRIDEKLRSREARMLLQVHDELVLEVPESELDRIQQKIVELMQSVAQLDVPLIVDVGVGANWDEAH
jgi:DNA polymerase-1